MGNFEQSANELLLLLKQHFENSSRPENQVVFLKPRPEAAKLFGERLGYDPSDFASNAKLFLDFATRLHSAKNLGHQVSAPHFIASLFEWAGAATNQASGIYEVGPSSNGSEKAMVDLFCSRLGFSAGDGFATHGGTIGNLTALLAARNVVDDGAWENGPKKELVLFTGADAHYSVSRAAGIMGMGASNVVKIALDDRRRMRPEKLNEAIEEAKRGGKTPVAVVATSGSTPVGAFDPLEEIAEISEKHGIWYHVDGAHGASMQLSKKHRHLLQGIERSTSVAWDAHKLMAVPALCTFLLFRRKEDSFRAFRQNAPYLFDVNASIETDGANRTLECTRRALAVPVWGLWSTMGEAFFETHIDALLAITREFHELLKQAPDFEPLHEPESNILCFRYLAKGVRKEQLGELQRQIRSEVVRRGSFYITQTVLDGEGALRVTVMNSRTDRNALSELLEEVRMVAQSLVER